MIDEREIVQHAVERLAPPEPSFERLVRRRDRKHRNQRITAGVVGIAVFVATVWILATGGPFDRGLTPAGTPTVPPVPAAAVVGLPPAGATPSVPEHGELVSQFGETWVYADGRIIWHRSNYHPDGVDDASSGFFEQRLTPEGVASLRSTITSTGLFDHDTNLTFRPSGDFLDIRVRDGDRLIRVTWAPGHNYWAPTDEQTVATPEQADALEQLDAFLSDPSSWPQAMWEDPTIVAYVPTWYSVCVRGYPHPVDPARIIDLLPMPAQDLLHAGDQAQNERMPGDCWRVTTDDARKVAQVLDGARFQRNPFATSLGALQYLLPDPGASGNNVSISFGPVLPHGEAAFFGPG